MSMPFYVSPEQVMKDRADYARKGIARGRSLVALECARRRRHRRREPVPHAATRSARSTTASRSPAVGKYNEFQMLRVAGVRHADLKGYSYSREDVSAQELANAYAQTLGQVFTHEMKPYEVEILVAEVGAHRRRPRRAVPHPLRRRRHRRAGLHRARRLRPKQITEALKAQYHRRAWSSAPRSSSAPSCSAPTANSLARRPARGRAARPRPARAARSAASRTPSSKASSPADRYARRLRRST